MDNAQRDRFELLSAYLDGETSAVERKRVQQWLDEEPEIQHLYTRLMKLREGMQSIPVPAPQHSPEELTKRVLAVHRQRQQRRLIIWSGGAIAATVLGALATLFGGELFAPQMAQTTAPSSPSPVETLTTNTLMISLNQPVIEIPKAAKQTQSIH